MVYIIRSGEYAKVGYTNDVNKRIQAYKTHNPSAELIYATEGNMDLEKHIHKELSDIKHNREWFYYSDNFRDRVEDIIKEYNGVSPSPLSGSFTMVFDLSFIYDLTSIHDIRIFFALCEYAEYNHGKLYYDKHLKSFLFDRTGVHPSNVSKHIKTLVACGAIKKYCSCVYINPNLVFKGDERTLPNAKYRYALTGKRYELSELLKV